MCYTVKMKLEGNTLSLNYCVELFNSSEYLYIVFFICFRPVGIVANYSKNFQIMLSIGKELLGLFPTCWSITSHC